MTKQKTEIAKINNNAALDISRFDSFQVTDITPSNIVLIQGANPLKDSLGVKNGEFVADNGSLGTEFEFMPIKSTKMMDVFKSDPSVEGGAPKEDFVEQIIETDTICTQDGRVVDLTQVDEDDMFPILFRGNNGYFYQRKKVMIVAIAGMPYRMVFKSRSKHIAAKKIGDVIMKQSKLQGFNDPIEGVFKMMSEELLGKRGKYWSMKCGFVRKATDIELADIAPFIQIDVTKSKDDEDASF